MVHAEVEALFDLERKTPNSVRAKSIVRERLGELHAEVFADGVVQPEWDVTDDFCELAEELEGSTPPEVVRQVGSAPASLALGNTLYHSNDKDHYDQFVNAG